MTSILSPDSWVNAALCMYAERLCLLRARSVSSRYVCILVPMIFMYVTTLAATAVTARNLYVTIAANPKMTGLPVAGAWAMIVVSVLLFVAAILIGWDGFKAYLRYGAASAPRVPHSAVAGPTV